MVVKNKWVGYLDRTYQQIKSSVLSKLSIYLPEMTDHTESNPFIIEVDVWAGLTEHLLKILSISDKLRVPKI